MSTDLTKLSKHDQKEIRRLQNYKKLHIEQTKTKKERINMEKTTLIGEWDTENQFFWLGANGNEYVAFLNAEQILVYPCDDPNHRPSAIIENKERIRDLETFSNTLTNGTTLLINGYTPEVVTHSGEQVLVPLNYKELKS